MQRRDDETLVAVIAVLLMAVALVMIYIRIGG